jgi:hypothetical protein
VAVGSNSGERYISKASKLKRVMFLRDESGSSGACSNTAVAKNTDGVARKRGIQTPVCRALVTRDSLEGYALLQEGIAGCNTYENLDQTNGTTASHRIL